MPKVRFVSLALLLAACGGNGGGLDCGQNGTCNPQCAVGEDPDCGSAGCVMDGKCNPKCPKASDPDCPNCAADGNCNAACAAGTDPDCPTTAGPQQAVWPGFNGAAGTMKGKSYQVSGALVPGDYGTTAAGSSHQVDTGVRH
jgi:hypothetical protein